MEWLGEEHVLVSRLLTQKGHFAIASKLDSLRQKRAKADYNLHAAWDADLKNEAEKSIQLSDYIITQIKASPLLKRT
jgi:hypothetical protein